MITTNDVYNYLNEQTITTPFIPHFQADIELSRALEGYHSAFTYYDGLFLKSLHRDRVFSDIFTNEDDIVQSVEMTVKMLRYPILNMYRTIIQEYNPIENYDKMSEITTDYMGKEKTTYNTTDANVKSGSVADSKVGKETNNETGSIQDVNMTSAYNKSDFTPNDSSTTTYNNHKNETTFDNRTDTTTYNNVTDTATKTGTDTKDFEDRQDKIVEHTHGNIGVTTSAQMLESERVLSYFNFIERVYDLIINYMCEWGWSD